MRSKQAWLVQRCTQLQKPCHANGTLDFTAFTILEKLTNALKDIQLILKVLDRFSKRARIGPRPKTMILHNAYFIMNYYILLH